MSPLTIVYVVALVLALGASVAGLALKDVRYYFVTLVVSVLLLLLLILGSGPHVR